MAIMLAVRVELFLIGSNPNFIPLFGMPRIAYPVVGVDVFPFGSLKSDRIDSILKFSPEESDAVETGLNCSQPCTPLDTRNLQSIHMRIIYVLHIGPVHG